MGVVTVGATCGRCGRCWCQPEGSGDFCFTCAEEMEHELTFFKKRCPKCGIRDKLYKKYNVCYTCRQMQLPLNQRKDKGIPKGINIHTCE